VYNCGDVEFLEVGILLANSHVEDGFGGGVDEGKGSSHLVVDGIELRQQDGVDFGFECFRGFLQQRLVELGDLVDGIVADQRLSNEDDQVGLVHLHQSRQLLHQRRVVLHPAGCVHQHCVDVLAGRLNRKLSTSLMASYAMTAGSSLYPFWKTGIYRFLPWVSICSTAPALKLSQAASMTDSLAFLSL
jgi:hypothetical protein